MVGQTPTNHNSDSNTSISRLAEAIAGTTSQQRPQAATMLKLVSTITLIFDGKNEKVELSEHLCHTMFKMQPKKTEATKTIHYSRKFSSTKRSTTNIQKYICTVEKNQ